MKRKLASVPDFFFFPLVSKGGWGGLCVKEIILKPCVFNPAKCCSF